MLVKQLSVCLFFLVALTAEAQNLKYIRALENQLDTLTSEEWKVLSSLSKEWATSDSSTSWAYYHQAFSNLQSETSEKYCIALLTKGLLYDAQNAPDSARLYLSQAKKIAGDIEKPGLESKVLEYLGRVNLKDGKTRLSISQFKRGIELSSELSNPELLFGHHANIAYAYHTLTNYDSAIFFYLKGASFCEINPTYACATLYNNMGITYQDKGELDRAEQYNYQSLEIRAKALDSVGIADSYVNIAGIHWFRGKIDSATYYVQRAFEIYFDRNHLRGQSLCLNNLGAVYNYQGNYSRAIEAYHQAILLYKRSSDQENLAAAYANIAEAQLSLGRNALALNYLDTGMVIANQVGSKMILRENYDLKSKAYEQIGEIGKAWEFRERYHDYKDSILFEANSRQVAELEAQFESENKERRINEQELQLTQQALIIQRNRWVIGSVIVLSILTLIVAWLQRNRIKLKSSQAFAEERSRLIEEQMDAVFNSVESERKRFSEDLHDGFGQYISLIKRKVEQLTELKARGEKEEIYYESQSILKEMGLELKNICFNLMPKTLIQHGLDAALREYLLRINGSNSIACEYISHGFEGEDRLQEVFEINMYRICQEWTNNIMKYSNAKRISVQIVKHALQVNMTIEDDGDGFDTSVLENSDSNGWKNISSRINLMKGEANIDTREGIKGTTLIIDVPLKLKESSGEVVKTTEA